MTAQPTGRATGRKRTLSTVSHVGVHADAPPLPEQPGASTLARPDARTDARPYARPRDERPGDQVYTGALGEVYAHNRAADHLGDRVVADERDREDQIRALTADALALRSARKRVEERASALRTRIDRCRLLSPEEVTGILAVHGVSRDMLTP